MASAQSCCEHSSSCGSTQSAFDDDPDRNLIPIIATIPREQIEHLVRKFGGDPDAPMFGSDV